MGFSTRFSSQDMQPVFTSPPRPLGAEDEVNCMSWWEEPNKGDKKGARWWNSFEGPPQHASCSRCQMSANSEGETGGGGLNYMTRLQKRREGVDCFSDLRNKCVTSHAQAITCWSCGDSNGLRITERRHLDTNQLQSWMKKISKKENQKLLLHQNSQKRSSNSAAAAASTRIFLASADHAVTSCPSFFQKQLQAVTYSVHRSLSGRFHLCSINSCQLVLNTIAFQVGALTVWLAVLRGEPGLPGLLCVAVVSSTILTSTGTWWNIFFPHPDF